MTATKLPERSRPTNADIMDAVRELHQCVDAVDRKADAIARTVKEDRHHAAGALTKLQAQVALESKTGGERMARIEGGLEAIMQSLGMKLTSGGETPQPVKRFGSQHPGTVVLQIFGAATGAIAAMKFFGPGLGAFAAAIWAAIQHS